MSEGSELLRRVWLLDMGTIPVQIHPIQSMTILAIVFATSSGFSFRY